MPYYSKRSKDKLATCHPDLIRLFNYVIKHYDNTIIYGRRGKKKQNDAFKNGRSELEYPHSYHNKTPSLAVDSAPYPINWAEDGTEKEKSINLSRFYHYAGYVKGVADMIGIEITWGGDWDSDNDFHDQKFNDLVHWQLKNIGK